MTNSAGFLEHVKSHFIFLIDDFGFRIVAERQQGDTALITYNSNSIFVRILKGPPDFEPIMDFGRLGIDDQPDAHSFEGGDLIQLDSCLDWKWQRRKNDLYGGRIAELARLLKECGANCLLTDDKVFSEMQERRDKLLRDWELAEHLKAIRIQAQSAWNVKDFLAVATLYAEIEDELTTVEQKRLSYARKQIEEGWR